jgi:predicted dehydrogenase
MSEPLGIGIVGYGKVASNQHRKWISAREDTRIAAVCDVTGVRREAAAAENPETDIYDIYEDMLDNEKVELILITTPPNTHCELALKAIERGRNVIVDKPFAMNLDEADRMLAAAEKQGTEIHCNQSRRYDREYRAIVRAAEQGMIGDILHIRRVWSQYGTVWANWGVEGFNPTWRIQREFGGGMVYDYAPHCGDQVLKLISKPLKSVFADARSLKFSKEVDDHFSCMMRFEGGATVYLEASNMAMLAARPWYVIGSSGCITADKINGPIQVFSEGSSKPEEMPPVDEKDELYDNIVNSCRGTASPSVTPAELRASTGLIDAIFESAGTGKTVQME